MGSLHFITMRTLLGLFYLLLWTYTPTCSEMFFENGECSVCTDSIVYKKCQWDEYKNSNKDKCAKALKECLESCKEMEDKMIEAIQKTIENDSYKDKVTIINSSLVEFSSTERDQGKSNKKLYHKFPSRKTICFGG